MRKQFRKFPNYDFKDIVKVLEGCYLCLFNISSCFNVILNHFKEDDNKYINDTLHQIVDVLEDLRELKK